MAIRAYITDLLEGKTVPSSKIPEAKLEQYMADCLICTSVHGTRRTVRVRSADVFRQWLKDNDESYRVLDAANSSTRASLAASTGNSKLVTVRSCPGFPVNSYEPLECKLNGSSLVINPQVGSFLFICDWKSFSIPDDVIVIGIENMENFRMVYRQKEFFEQSLGHHRFLFVSRYPQSTDLRAWLMSITNNYVHVGDFDLAGIRIFQTEFERYLPGRAAYLIPDDIDMRLKAGSPKRYDEQLKVAGNISSDNPSLQRLIDLIHRERKGYDQEGYIM